MVKRTLGLAVSRDRLRGVLVHEGVAEWGAEVPFDPTDGLEPPLEVLLAQAPLDGRGRVRVRVALGPGLAQVKRLGGLPGDAEPETLDRLVSENADAFFLENGIPLVTSRVEDCDGGPVAAAYHAPVIQTISDVLGDHGLSVDHFVPSVVAATSGTPDPAFRWSDGAFEIEVRRNGEAVPYVKPAYGGSELSAPRPASALAALGQDGGRYCDAYGAATRDENALTYTPGGQRRRHRSRKPRGRPASRSGIVTWGLVALTSLTALVAPLGLSLLAASREERLAEARGPYWDRVVRARADLEIVSRRLARIRAHTGQPLATPILSDLGRALPPRSAIVSLELDGGMLEVEVLAENAAAIVGALAEAPSVRTAAITGTVSREVVDEEALERATLALGLRGAASRSRPKPAESQPGTASEQNTSEAPPGGGGEP